MKRSALKFYFSIVSILSIGGAIVSGGILAYNLLNKVLVTDEEYLNGGSRSREITNCDQPAYAVDGKSSERSPEKIKICKADATDRAIKGRSYDLKQSMIGGATWLVICLLVFAFHYRKLKDLKED